MASHSSCGPPSYQESLSCDVLNSKRVITVPQLSAAEDGDVSDLSFLPPVSSFGGSGSAVPSFGGGRSGANFDFPALDHFGGNHDAVARVSAATEENATEFIWWELSKELKIQWEQRALRAVLDECPRYAPPSGGDRFVRLFVDITSGSFSSMDWQRESDEMMQFIIGGVGNMAVPAFPGVVDGDQGARDRISTATEENAIHFIWAELPKELKAEWERPLIRNVLDCCPKFVLMRHYFHLSVSNNFVVGTRPPLLVTVS